jgi:hypothetical protein
MTSPTAKERAFLESQGIPLSGVFDASGMSRGKYQRVMKDLGKDIAIGVSPCREAGHTMRTRSGHCFQCNTHSYAFLKRFDDSNSLYVATSASSNIVKVGVTKDAQQREDNLNATGYGGIRDWKMAYHFVCDRAGRMEHRVHDALSQYRVSKSYEKEGSRVDCQELFSCSIAEAISICKNVALAFGAVPGQNS